jgi:hypothetical protein
VAWSVCPKARGRIQLTFETQWESAARNNLRPAGAERPTGLTRRDPFAHVFGGKTVCSKSWLRWGFSYR